MSQSIIRRMLPAPARRFAQKTRKLASMGWQDFRTGPLNAWFPAKPAAISFMANDICNSKCKMCLIWEKKKDHEVTPDELRQILSDDLFTKVADLGVTGGEPTLRKDLPDLYRAACQTLPNLRHCSTITNAVNEKQVIERVLSSAEACREFGVGFSVMVSIDGVGGVHDLNRGRAGNFETAVRCVEAFKANGLSTAFGCTFTNLNADCADEMLDFAIERGWYGRFRVAEFIERLYNSSQSDAIRNFSDLQAYNLALFFKRAEAFERSPAVKKTYRSIRGMLIEGKKRSTGCPYHADNVILTSRGELLYCSPKSPVLGNALDGRDAKSIYFSNLPIKQEIKEKHCDDCIHDYHVNETLAEKMRFWAKSKAQQARFDLSKQVKRAQRIRNAQVQPVDDPANLKSESVLIVGWYGTETIGDKAILWSIIQRLRRRTAPPNKIYLSSLHPYITYWTLRELELANVEVVETYSEPFRKTCRTVDEVVIGGGPLMHIDAMDHMLYAFNETVQRGGIARVEGCGLGPLDTVRHQQGAKQLLRLSSNSTLRDQASAEYARSKLQQKAETTEDPSAEYVRSIAGSYSGNEADLSGSDAADVCFFLREPSFEYAGNLSQDEYQKLADDFEHAIVESAVQIVGVDGLKVHLMPMHSFTIGGDDRVFARRLCRRIEARIPEFADRVSFQRLPASPREIIAAMKTCQVAVCMRFHSVLFANTLGVPFVAIDYTRGGKIHGYLSDQQALDRMISLGDVIDGKLEMAVHAQLAAAK